ncbi:MAG: hypothetical protein IJL97_01380 [Lachnospiraceae bacterium]|nr:hypothetical protein [Lachnospiraceae bacterium]
MIESIVNYIQLATSLFCTVISVYMALTKHKNVWIILAFASGVFFLGDAYWELYLTFYGVTPQYSYISYFSWNAAFVFFLLLVLELRGEGHTRVKHKWLIAAVTAFTVGMCIFYMQFGDWLGNIATVLFMSPLIWQPLDALLTVHEKKRKDPGTDDRRCGLYRTVLLFCMAEYCMWTVSCFWTGHPDLNPYYWFDTLLSFTFVLLPFALRKAVDK